MVRSPLFVVAASAVIAAATVPACASASAPTTRPTAVASGPGTSDLNTGWQIQSSATADGSGAQISQPGYAASGWLPISRPETLMAGLVENGRYPDVFYSDRLKTVPTAQFDVNWWYRNQLTLHPRP